MSGDGADGADVPDVLVATRRDLQRLATHVLARARALDGGHFGLRATATGIGTPAFGPAGTVLRLAGTTLVREDQTSEGAHVELLALEGASLADAAGLAGVDLALPFTPGADAPGVGDPRRRLALDPPSVGRILAWFVSGAGALDAVLPDLAEPTVAQLWPEHFDIGLSASTASGGVNLGASPGDDAVPEPYLYVAPWTAARPGDPEYWNAPFGAVLTSHDLAGAGDPTAAGAAFLRLGLDALG